MAKKILKIIRKPNGKKECWVIEGKEKKRIKLPYDEIIITSN